MLLVVDMVAVKIRSLPSVAVLAVRSIVIPESSASRIIPVAVSILMETPTGAPLTLEIWAITVSSPSNSPSTVVVTWSVPALFPFGMVMVEFTGITV